MGGASEDILYWSEDPSILTALLKSSPAGLTSVQAATQLGRVGPNSVEDTPRLSALRLLLRQFERLPHVRCNHLDLLWKRQLVGR